MPSNHEPDDVLMGGRWYWPMKVRVAIAFFIALLVLGLFILAVGWDAVFSALARASVAVYVLAFLGCVLMFLGRSIVWHLLLGTVDKRRPYWLVGGVFLTAMFAKYVTPYGQVASGIGVAAVVSRYYESAYEESLAAILSADFLNYIPYYTLGGLGLGYYLFVDGISIPLGPYLPLGTVIVAGALLIFASVWWGRTTVMTAAISAGAGVRRKISRFFPEFAKRLKREKIVARFQGFSTTLTLLSRERSTILFAVCWAHIAWIGLAVALYFSASAVGETLPVGIVFLCLALSKLGFIMPTPGGVGGVEIALAGVLYAVSPASAATATAIAILYRFATYWFTILVGGVTTILLTVSDPTPP